MNELCNDLWNEIWKSLAFIIFGMLVLPHLRPKINLSNDRTHNHYDDFDRNDYCFV